MRILFDQCTPLAIRRFPPNHEIRTAHEQGWSTLVNGELLQAAEEAGFDLLLTTDTHIPEQQNLGSFKLAIVLLTPNRWSSILARITDVVSAVDSASPGTCTILKL